MSDPPRLVLASGSPRRADVLRQLGLSFEIEISAIDEALLPAEGPHQAAEKSTRMVKTSATQLPRIICASLLIAMWRAKTCGEPRKPRPISAMPITTDRFIRLKPPGPHIFTRPGSICCSPE